MKQVIRQPIVTVVGHVDHGKTSILDRLRQSSIHMGEAGGITQKISFTLYPSENLKKACPLIEKSGIKLDIPGFLLIDTPGHAAFTNLRKRGGSLADLAVLVIDVNEGIKPQTSEVIQILKHNKTPFVIALNKIDNISGWKFNFKDDLKKSIESQGKNTKQNFDEKYMTLIGSLSAYGFESDLYYNIADFTKKIALVPISAKTKEGISELILMLCGLSQKYLGERLKLGREAKGVVLEVKKEKTNNYIEAILYDGELGKKDEIAVSTFDGEPVISKIRILEEIEPMSFKFKPKEKVVAATGLRLQLAEKADILSGMPFVLYEGNKEKIKQIFKKEISENIMTEKEGIIAKADSLGSLEALLVLLKQGNIPVMKAGIGDINKGDIIAAKANQKINELDAIVIGFNVGVDNDAKDIAGNIKILREEVIYKLIENLAEFRNKKRIEIEKNRMMEMATICKVRILPQYLFRNTKPAIFGVKIEGGKLVKNLILIDSNGKKVGRIKNIQSNQKPVAEATEDMEVAISVSGANFERGLKGKEFLYSMITENHFKIFEKNRDLLSSRELSVLREIAEIRKSKNFKEDEEVGED